VIQKRAADARRESQPLQSIRGRDVFLNLSDEAIGARRAFPNRHRSQIEMFVAKKQGRLKDEERFGQAA
jgi:hypothetical protein